MSEARILLSSLKPGASALVCGFLDHSSDRQLSSRMMEMGLTLGSQIEVAFEAPFGGAIAVRCRGTLIALRLDDAAIVEVRAL